MEVTRRSALLQGLGLGAAALLPRAHAAAPAAAGHRLVVVRADGGWDTSYALDPKLDNDGVEGPEVDPGGAAEEVVAFSGIPVATNLATRPAVARFFDRYADRSIVINGIDVGSISHGVCRVRTATGTRLRTSPDLGAIVGAAYGEAAAIPYMDLGGGSFPGPLASSSGRTGAVNQLKLLLDPGALGDLGLETDHPYPLFAPRADDRAAIRDLIGARTQRFRDAVAPSVHNDRMLDAFDESLDRSALIEDSPDLLDKLRFGRTLALSDQIDLAVDLLSLGLSQTVLLDDGLPWDTHTNNVTQGSNHEALFTGLDQLALSLADRGLIDDTVIIVLSELGRTPRRNASNGKDHWPVTSALVFGGGVQGGRVIGGTTDEVEAEPVDLQTGEIDPNGSIITYDTLIASLLSLMGVDPAAWLPDAEVIDALS